MNCHCSLIFGVFFYIMMPMKNVKALFIDCDGVLYDKEACTYHDIAIIAFGKALDALNIPREEVPPTRARLKAKGVHGLLNAALALCQERHIDFNVFADVMAQNTDYNRIPKDVDMLRLLRECGAKVPIYIVTNNTAPHLQNILNCLNGGKIQSTEDLKIHLITIEDTLRDGVFFPKKAEGQLPYLCAQIGEKPEDVLLLDDTQDVCDAALAQGLQVAFVGKPCDTKAILRRIIHEKSRSKRAVSVRKTRGRAGR